VALTLDDNPFPWDDWDAVAQVRRAPNSADILGTFEISTTGLPAGSARFTLDGLNETGYWDVQFTNQDTSQTVTWPGPLANRHLINITPDVTRAVPDE
jgi:hypothetical protein